MDYATARTLGRKRITRCETSSSAHVKRKSRVPRTRSRSHRASLGNEPTSRVPALLSHWIFRGYLSSRRLHGRLSTCGLSRLEHETAASLRQVRPASISTRVPEPVRPRRCCRCLLCPPEPRELQTRHLLREETTTDPCLRPQWAAFFCARLVPSFRFSPKKSLDHKTIRIGAQCPLLESCQAPTIRDGGVRPMWREAAAADQDRKDLPLSLRRCPSARRENQQIPAQQTC